MADKKENEKSVKKTNPSPSNNNQSKSTAEGKTKAELKAERKKLHEIQMAEKLKKQPAKENTGKSKAQLKAERRAIQEAQRAEKSRQQTEGTGKSKSELKAERKALQESQKVTKDPKETQQQSLQPNESKQKKSDRKLKKSGSGANVSMQRVSFNVQMDSEKVQKRLTKRLAKQNVPQRSSSQKKVQMFSHLHQYEKDLSLTESVSLSSSNIHPAIIKLGLQYAQGIITGSNARCIAMLYALKRVINDYTTPPSKELSRDLESTIKPCISFLTQCRNLSVSMGNAIKFVKLQISQSPPNLPESEAKSKLIETIDQFIRERIILAGDMIKVYACDKINDGDNVLVYGFSSLIINILKYAKEDKNKDFKVVVVDSRPDFPGRKTLKCLVEADIKCSYVLINSISYIIKEVTTVLLGTHALLANGSVMARTGTSMVAMVAKANNVPVLTCCETYKFCERVQSDSFVFNELGDPDDMVRLDRPDKEDILTSWRDINNLYLLNLVYDVTPSDLVDMAITELGMIPCTSVPVVLRVKSTTEG